MNRPRWMPKWFWHPWTWFTHGVIQWCIYEIDPWAGWGFLPAWYYRDLGDHRLKPPWYWPLDGIMDVAVPILVQILRSFVL